MATIDLSVTPVREANELIRKYGADGIDRIKTYVDHCAARAPSLQG